MKVVVTQENIDVGRDAVKGRKACYVCPVALAMTAAGLREVSVSQHAAMWVTPDGFREALLPDVAVDWIERFDRGCDVEPFEFELVDLSD